MKFRYIPKTKNDCFFINVFAPGGVKKMYDVNPKNFIFTFLYLCKYFFMG